MCGIAGFFTQHPLEQQVIKLMTDAIAHRGPDAEGFYYKDRVALGHRRLSIIDLSAEANQPMYTADKRWIIVYNGEVYNFKELAERHQLLLRTHSDTEVVLELFSRMEKEAINEWNGMFAIALYDTLRERLFLIRDRIGIKPLYYYFNEGDLFFASELKAITKVVPKNKLTINHSAIRSFLQLGYIPGPATIYYEIKKLPAGTIAEIAQGEFKLESYWVPEEKIFPTTIKYESDAKKELERLLLSSVQYRMISDVPYGTFLSGGIDSSIVTAMAQKISSTPIKTFSIAFKEAQYDESIYAKNVATHLKTEHHEFTVTEKEALDIVEQMLDVYDEPYYDSSGIPTMLLSKLARQHVTMVLSGDGGDELFMGYGSHQWAQRLNQPLLNLMRKPIAGLLSIGNERMKHVAEMFNYPTYQSMPEQIFSQDVYLFSIKQVEKLLLNPSAPIALDYRGVKSRELTPEELQSFFDLKYYLRDDLMTKVDIASMQYALEVRVPLLDYRIVEFALNLSPDLRKRGNITKYLLKEVLYDHIPRDFFNRPKWGFGIPIQRWLKKDLRYLIDKYLSNEVIEKHGIVNKEIAIKIREDFLKNRTKYNQRIWALIVLHRWLEHNS